MRWRRSPDIRCGRLRASSIPSPTARCSTSKRRPLVRSGSTISPVWRWRRGTATGLLPSWRTPTGRRGTCGCRPDRIRAIYDADSLSLVAESTAAGIAAATWSAFGEAGEHVAPSPEEAAAWVREYERAGRPLSVSQRHAAGGAILHALAYTARCEHALEVGHPELGRPRRARDRLEPGGADYIERFEEACEARR